jgi:glycosyl-4,4'-diaponeurosporenoate acyltransferase
VPIELPVPWVIALNALGLPALQLGCAWIFTRLPAAWFHPPLPKTDRSRGYERFLGIKRWKDRLPDGASWFKGGFAKASLRQRDPQHLARFLRETWRGELCHWTVLALIPVFFLWNPGWADLVIAAYALAANLPCILVLRYNRQRLSRVLRSSEC